MTLALLLSLHEEGLLPVTPSIQGLRMASESFW